MRIQCSVSITTATKTSLLCLSPFSSLPSSSSHSALKCTNLYQWDVISDQTHRYQQLPLCDNTKYSTGIYWLDLVNVSQSVLLLLHKHCVQIDYIIKSFVNIWYMISFWLVSQQQMAVAKDWVSSRTVTGSWYLTTAYTQQSSSWMNLIITQNRKMMRLMMQLLPVTTVQGMIPCKFIVTICWICVLVSAPWVQGWRGWWRMSTWCHLPLSQHWVSNCIVSRHWRSTKSDRTS